MFTEGRENFKIFIEILRKFKMDNLVKRISVYNDPPARLSITYDQCHLYVNVTDSPKTDNSKYFKMDKEKRGKCIIINNLADHKITDADLFGNIFEQLHFTVEKWENKTAKELKKNLEILSKNKDLLADDALVIMLISHGCDENILGINNCRKVDKEEWESFKANKDKKALKKDVELDKDDIIPISEIVDIFSEEKCKYLEKKPKIFFFNCCRIKEGPDDNTSEKFCQFCEEKKISRPLSSLNNEWIKMNKFTLICYSCSEGSFPFLLIFVHKVQIQFF